MSPGLTTRQLIAHRIREQSVGLAERWLERLQEMLTVDRLEVFPSHQLLDHVPEVIGEIAAFIEWPDDGHRIEHNDAVLARAAALGKLRHVQHASVHQLLHEYRLLAELLETFVEAEVAKLPQSDAREVVQVMRRMGEAVRVLQQHTVDTFVGHYTTMIERQTSQLRTFSRLVSHEIRQPLAVLQVITRALPVTEGCSDSARMMDIFDRSVARLAEVTSKLERLARITSATDLSPDERTVDLTEVAHHAAAQLTDAARARGVEVRVESELPVLRLDPARAELVFLNLIGNAIKFSDPAKAQRYVVISRAASDDPGVIVRDNGVGMPAARLQTIFREFVRAHAQRDGAIQERGLGLGLSIVRECMDHANGSVRVDSIDGRGTSFKLTWPGRADPDSSTSAAR